MYLKIESELKEVHIPDRVYNIESPSSSSLSSSRPSFYMFYMFCRFCMCLYRLYRRVNVYEYEQYEWAVRIEEHRVAQTTRVGWPAGRQST